MVLICQVGRSSQGTSLAYSAVAVIGRAGCQLARRAEFKLIAFYTFNQGGIVMRSVKVLGFAEGCFAVVSRSPGGSVSLVEAGENLSPAAVVEVGTARAGSELWLAVVSLDAGSAWTVPTVALCGHGFSVGLLSSEDVNAARELSVSGIAGLSRRIQDVSRLAAQGAHEFAKSRYVMRTGGGYDVADG